MSAWSCGDVHAAVLSTLNQTATGPHGKSVVHCTLRAVCDDLGPWLRLHLTVDRLLLKGGEKPASRAKPADLQDLRSQLDNAIQLVSAKTIDTLLSFNGGAVGVALLRLLAVVVRSLPYPEPTARDLFRQQKLLVTSTSAEVFMIVASVTTAASETAEMMSCPSVVAFIRKLVRMHTLQAAARQIAAAADRLATATERRKAWVILTRICTLTVPLVNYAVEASSIISANPPGQLADVVAAVNDVIAALRDSAVLEHAARLAVRLLEVEAGQHPREGGALHAESASIREYGLACLVTALFSVDSAMEPPAALVEAVVGPCASHAAMVLGLAVLCELDGGPAYGLARELIDAVSCLIPGHHSARVLISLKALATVSANGFHRGRLGRRAALSVLLRVARVGLLAAVSRQRPGPSTAGAASSSGSAQGTARQSGSAASATATAEAVEMATLQGRGDRSRLWSELTSRNGASLTVQSLSAALGLLRPGNGAAGFAEAVEFWRLLVGMSGVAGDGQSNAFPALCYLIGKSFGTEILFPPADPPPMLAAALAGGLLPGLERLIRQAAAEPEGAAMGVLGELSTYGGFCYARQFWAPLLAYSDPRQAAALVVTLTKAIRLLVKERVSNNISNRTLFAAHAFCIVAMGFKEVATAAEQQHFARLAAEEAAVHAAWVELPGPASQAATQSGGEVAAEDDHGQSAGPELSPLAERSWCEAAVETAEGGTAKQAAGPQPSPAASQLHWVLGLALQQWLPELAQMKYCLDLPHKEDPHPQQVLSKAFGSQLTGLILRWAPVLFVLRRRQGQGLALSAGRQANSDGCRLCCGSLEDSSSSSSSQGSSPCAVASQGRGSSVCRAVDAGVGSNGRSAGDLEVDDKHDVVVPRGYGGEWELLGRALQLARSYLSDDLDALDNARAAAWACLTLASAFPDDLRAATVAAAAALQGSGGSSSGSGCTDTASEVPRSLPVPPDFLRDHLAPVLRTSGVEDSLADALERLAEQVEAWAAGGGDAGTVSILGPDAVEYVMADFQEMASILAAGAPGYGPVDSPLIATCANPGCTRLDGDSEADVQLLPCGYCCEECRERELCC